MRKAYPPTPSVTRRLITRSLLGLLLLASLWAEAQERMTCTTLPSSAATSISQKPGPGEPPVQVICGDVQNIRVNIHFMQHDNGMGNFTANNDGRPGTPSTAIDGYGYAKSLIWAMNGEMDQYPPLRLAPGSSLTPIRKRIKWVLDGVYFDRSSHYRNGAGYNSIAPLYNSPFLEYNPLCVKGDSIVNLFLVEEILWPYNGPIGNNNYTSPFVSSVGVRAYVYYQAFCNTSPAPAKLWAVIANCWTKHVMNGTPAWAMAATANHELCHALGLGHPFQNLSGCADAPMHPNTQPGGPYLNCWNLNNPATTDCDTLTEVSNNVMDYNASSIALSPCQIGIMQNNLNTCLQSRYVYKCSDCLPTKATFDLPASTCGNLTNIWLDGRASWENHYFKLEIDRLNALGQPISQAHFETTQWRVLGREQLDSLYFFATNTTYRVKVTTYNYCGSTSVRVRNFSTEACNLTPMKGQALLTTPSTPSSRR